MNLFPATALFGATLLVSWALGWCVFKFLSARQIVDVPNARSSHVRPTVRGGGVAIQTAIVLGILVIASALNSSVLMIAPVVVLLAAVSIWDDLGNVPAGVRLAVHVAVAVGALALLGWPEWKLAFSPSLTLSLPAFVSFVLGVLLVAGMINAFNFMDGINGHAAMQTVVTSVASAIIVARFAGEWSAQAALFLVISGAATGFLPHNFPGARMFMGDVGSVPLGGALAVLILWSARDFGWELLLPLVFLHFNFILDTGATLLRRALRGKKLSEPHREHLYERLALATGSHARVVATEVSVLLLATLLLLAYPTAGPAARLSLLMSVAGLWVAYYFASDVFCRKRRKG